MTIELTLKLNTCLELAIGKVSKGKEAVVFGEYFPVVAPVMQECGIQQLGSFAVIEANSVAVKPEMGSFTQCPSADNFLQFYNDPRFLKVKALRDNALDLLLDGNFFKPVEQVVSFNTDCDYALVISESNPLATTPILSLSFANNSPRKIYTGKVMALHLWSEKTEQLMSKPEGEVLVLRIRFNPANR